jgi:hypothetical protein
VHSEIVSAFAEDYVIFFIAQEIHLLQAAIKVISILQADIALFIEQDYGVYRYGIAIQMYITAGRDTEKQMFIDGIYGTFIGIQAFVPESDIRCSTGTKDHVIREYRVSDVTKVMAATDAGRTTEIVLEMIYER